LGPGQSFVRSNRVGTSEVFIYVGKTVACAHTLTRPDIPVANLVVPPWVNVIKTVSFVTYKRAKYTLTGKSYLRERPSTVDLLVKMGCFVKTEKYCYTLKSSLSKLVRTRRSTVLILPLQ
jgi:hypothetical protein